MIWSTFLVMAYCKCVIVSSKRSDVVSGRIKGGLDVVKGDLSFITKITKNGKHVCNGALVDRRWLLTVRDCIYEKRLSQYKVYFKPMDSETVPMNLVRTIRKIVVPSTGPQDIVLARLNKKLKRKEDNVRPFDRFSFQEIEPKLIRCKTVGFSPNGKLLNEIDITTDSAERCRVTSETDTCPFDIVGGKVCKEDNGSPIICKLDVTNDKKWYLAGLTAIDNGCKAANIKGKRLSYFRDFIMETIRGKNPSISVCPEDTGAPTSSVSLYVICYLFNK